MAAPQGKNMKNMNGVWAMNKAESDPTDPILSAQGIGFLIRKAVNFITVTLIVTQSEDATDGSEHIKIVQPGTAGLPGTEENRVIPKDPEEKMWNDHKDHVFGAVKGYTQWRQISEFKDDEDDAFLKQGWTSEDPLLLDGFAESQGNGWTARQVWGFAKVNGVRKHVRRVVVRKGSNRATANFVYDFKGERES